MGEILLIALGTFIILNVPIAFSIGGAALLAIYLQGRIPLFIVVQKLFTGMDSFPLLRLSQDLLPLRSLPSDQS